MFSDILITADYDRTLTAVDGTVPRRNLEAIRHFMDNGGVFTVNTGRAFPMSRAIRDNVQMNGPLLLANGSLAYDLQAGKVDFYHEIPLDLEQTIRWCREQFPDLTVEVQGLESHYVFEHNPGWERFRAYNRCPYRYVQLGEEDLGPFVKFAVYGEIREKQLASMFVGTPQEIQRMDRAEKILREKFGDFCEIIRPAARIIDIHAKGVSKIASARQLQKKLGRKILICVGDAANDLTMLEGADYAFCPSDGAVADRFPNVCPCAEGALADVIYNKIPEILKNANL